MKHVLITGGAGFIGTNLAHRLLNRGIRVRVLDNLSRPGSEVNLRWLMDTHPGDGFEFRRGDVRDFREVCSAADGVDRVFHFAAQVAVTSSVSDPITDFAVNAGGTLNILEAIRRQSRPPSLLYTSTNKTYGALEDIVLDRKATCYLPRNPRYRRGIDEGRHLDFHSPYGCSKGSADQYVIDYARIYGVKTVVFRMSCIYGLHQFGNEDQGWVAHFALQTLKHEPLAIYGDGAQVRDLLFVDDLIDALLLAGTHLSAISGRVFNVGGGAGNAVSLLDLMRMLGELHGSVPRFYFRGWRPGDQRYYVSDYRSFRGAVGWEPRTGVREGLRRLYEWMGDYLRTTETRTAEAS